MTRLSGTKFGHTTSIPQYHALRSLYLLPLRHNSVFLGNCKPYSSRPGPYDDAANATDLDAARKWFSQFNGSTIPTKVAKTTFSRSSGPGGQKTNKTSSKATTVWPMSTLKSYLPNLLHDGLRTSSYYVASSDSMSIQCDMHRTQSGNQQETHDRLAEEIGRIYKKRVPGITSPEQKLKIDKFFGPLEGRLLGVDYKIFVEAAGWTHPGVKKSENVARLNMKKKHGDKKRARSGGQV